MKSMAQLDKLKELAKKRISQEEAFEFFDSLDTVNLEDTYGLWKGEELKTGHPMEGLLTASSWYGKKFIDNEHVHPLVFQKEDGFLFAGNPGRVSLDPILSKLPKTYVSLFMKLARPFIITKKSRARLRLVDYRGKASASMIYDQKPIIDIFRKVDEDTMLGVMDIKNFPSEKSYFFYLKRVQKQEIQ